MIDVEQKVTYCDSQPRKLTDKHEDVQQLWPAPGRQTRLCFSLIHVLRSIMFMSIHTLSLAKPETPKTDPVIFQQDISLLVFAAYYISWLKRGHKAALWRSVIHWQIWTCLDSFTEMLGGRIYRRIKPLQDPDKIHWQRWEYEKGDLWEEFFEMEDAKKKQRRLQWLLGAHTYVYLLVVLIEYQTDLHSIWWDMVCRMTRLRDIYIVRVCYTTIFYDSAVTPDMSGGSGRALSLIAPLSHSPSPALQLSTTPSLSPSSSIGIVFLPRRPFLVVVSMTWIQETHRRPMNSV